MMVFSGTVIVQLETALYFLFFQAKYFCWGKSLNSDLKYELLFCAEPQFYSILAVLWSDVKILIAKIKSAAVLGIPPLNN